MKFHDLIHRAILTLLVTSLLACSKDDKPNAIVPTTSIIPTTSSVQVLDIQDVNSNMPNFESQGKLTEVIKSPRERKAIQLYGCRNRDVIDPSMQVGDKRIIRRLLYRQGEHLQEIRSNQIQSIRARIKIAMNEEILSMVIAEAGGEIIQNRFSIPYLCEKTWGREQSSICKKKEQKLSDENFLNSITQRGRQHLENTKNISHCEIEAARSSSVQRETEIGLFVVGDQAKVKAIKETTSYTGRVVCKQGNVKTDMGLGTAVTIEIRSNKVVPGPEHMDNCGGTLVTSGTTVSVDGRVIQSNRMEVISAPLVNLK